MTVGYCGHLGHIGAIL